MKNRLFFFKMLLFVALMATWTSCSKSDDIEANDPKPVNPTPTNPTDKTDPKDDPYMVVCEHVVEVANNIETYYDKCNSLDELKKYFQDIKKINYVEDVYTNNTSMFVKIKDYGKISYSFYPRITTSSFVVPNKLMTKVKKIKKSPFYNKEEHSIMGLKKVAVVSAVQYDENTGEAIDGMNEARDIFNDCGFVISRDVIAPKVDFFRNDVFNYDIVFLLTHGGYDPQSGDHYWLTSEYPNENNHDLTKKDLYEYKDIPTDQVYFDCHYENRRGYSLKLYNAVVTEKWIASTSKRFENEGNAIVFNAACSSMKGNNPANKDSIGYSVAKIFTNRGAGMYLGYDEENFVGCHAGLMFFKKLLSGMSVENAFKTLQFEGLHNYNPYGQYWADLIAYPNPLYPKIEKSCIYSPFIHYVPDISNINDEIKVTLSKSAFFYNDSFTLNIKNMNEADVFYNSFVPLPLNSPICYGFLLSETENINNSQIVNRETVGNDNCYYINTNKIYFEYTLTYKPLMLGCMIAPETTYYYWAYFYDGHDYYISDMKSFTTPSLKEPDTPQPDTSVSGQGNLPNVPGSDL